MRVRRAVQLPHASYLLDATYPYLSCTQRVLLCAIRGSIIRYQCNSKSACWIVAAESSACVTSQSKRGPSDAYILTGISVNFDIALRLAW